MPRWLNARFGIFETDVDPSTPTDGLVGEGGPAQRRVHSLRSTSPDTRRTSLLLRELSLSEPCGSRYGAGFCAVGDLEFREDRVPPLTPMAPRSP